jgi:hypothetical protein
MSKSSFCRRRRWIAAIAFTAIFPVSRAFVFVATFRHIDVSVAIQSSTECTAVIMMTTSLAYTTLLHPRFFFGDRLSPTSFPFNTTRVSWFLLKSTSVISGRTGFLLLVNGCLKHGSKDLFASLIFFNLRLFNLAC